ncbi:MAG TPA: hypothetical protein VFH10_12335 [Nocardioides sp.]|uniref:hypothetical protein n=1 Tax=Nocardioides sp. TaxID=35761 RepID=UPI002D7F9BE9|nr:hypothetical protein [Nocardioides sp.]HET6653423.1 hypothetical protein [Nocardioides sp.]
MTAAHPPVDEAAREAERRKRLAHVFGDVLPDGTSDDRDDGRERSEGDTDDWLRRQVPPHHG